MQNDSRSVVAKIKKAFEKAKHEATQGTP